MTEKLIKTYDLDYERSILGSMLQSEEKAKIGLKYAKENYFYETNHKIIFKSIEEVILEKGPIDTLIVGKKLDSYEELNKIGGYQYLIDLQHAAGASCFIEEYCAAIENLTETRQMLAISASIPSDLSMKVCQ